MPYVSVPKDLFAIKTKFMFNLTKRQLYCFSSGGLIGISFHLFIQQYNIDSSISSFMLMGIVTPFFIFAMYEKNGKPLEVILKQILTHKFLVSSERPYKTKNLYTLIEEQDRFNKEVALIGRKKEQSKVDKRGKNTSKTNSCKKK